MKTNGRVVRPKNGGPARALVTRRKLARFKRLLRRHLPELKARYRVKSLGVFGSYVRGQARPRSDLDILIELDDPSLSLFGFIGLENYLSDLLGVKVDLVERDTLKPIIGQRILAEVIPI